MIITEEKTLDIANTSIDEYKILLINEMLKLGANELELNLIKDATIRNAIKRNRKPEDVAWAILQ